MSGAPSGWAAAAERGSLRALHLLQGLHRLLGRRVSRALLLPIAAYFALTDRSARRASREYLQTLYESPGGAEALGKRPRARDVLRHFHEFSVNLFDRMVVWGGAIDEIRFEHRGSEHLFRLAREGRGGILLGSHVGSFDMMRLLAGRYGLVVNVLMFTRQAQRIMAFFQSLDPSSRLRVIQLDPDQMRTAFEIRACLARGEFVGILGDRVPPGPGQRTARVPFLGREAAFSLRPFLLAAVLGKPLLFAVCLRRGPDAYEAVVEPIADGAPVPRAEREQRARAWLADYAARLETCCRQEPYQWFNFYPFWGPREEAT